MIDGSDGNAARIHHDVFDRAVLAPQPNLELPQDLIARRMREHVVENFLVGVEFRQAVTHVLVARVTEDASALKGGPTCASA